jgi:antitoxin MazE
MQAVIQRIGNSRGIRIPKKMLEDASLKENDTVELFKVRQGIIVKKSVPVYQSLDEVFEGYSGSLKCEEWDFGKDMGREQVW